ncbi:MAG: PAS domain S-box protein [Methanocalculus sp. MSAO_Arc1]|nr:MAG: PAS domain S-box protein [Methanocalculus sp. MSAO_Arc1]
MHCIRVSHQIPGDLVMNTQTEEIIKIKDLLKRYPRGMSVSEISSALHIHRNTAAKHLDILKLKGDVDRKQIGTAKNYFLIQRVPVSSLIPYWPEPVIICDSRLNTVMITEGILSILGCSLDVVYGVEIQDIPISLFKDPRIEELCHDAVQGKSGSITIQSRIRKQDLILRITSIPVVFDSGRDGAALSFFDETAMRKAKRELLMMKQHYNALSFGQKEYIVHINPDLTITFCNAAFSKRAGRSEEQLRGMKFHALFPAHTHDEIQTLFEEQMAAEEITTAELTMIGAHGTLGREQWEVRGVLDEKGKLLAYHAVGWDSTELAHCREQLNQYHKNLEDIILERTRSMQEANRMLMATIRDKEELEKELLFIQFAFDHASDSILLINEEGFIMRGNQAAADLLGYSTDELLSMRVFDINPEITPGVWKKMWEGAYPGKRERASAVHRMRNGSVIRVEVSRSFVRFADTMYFCSIARSSQPREEETH